MAVLLSLRRLFVYHCETAPGSAESQRFKVMERKLLRAIVNPAMVAVWVLGISLALLSHAYTEGWFQLKFALVLALSGLHGMFARWVKDFARDANKRPQQFYRVVNE